MTLRGIYEALGSPGVFAMDHRREATGWLVEEALNAAMDGAFAEALRLRRLASVTLAALSADSDARLSRRTSHCDFADESHAA
ncbi:hypothetical protein GCM10011335_26090 [Aureimonas glaciei]|uniref:Uncharacterized protein n=1 Tax=Aureimonas glaciei TaxID=1776957 RepID=A0A916XYY0_9HYPH|nr:hypothetical protein GCM10011335_26090 [Aureimonas glaciei]